MYNTINIIRFEYFPKIITTWFQIDGLTSFIYFIVWLVVYAFLVIFPGNVTSKYLVELATRGR